MHGQAAPAGESQVRQPVEVVVFVWSVRSSSRNHATIQVRAASFSIFTQHPRCHNSHTGCKQEYQCKTARTTHAAHVICATIIIWQSVLTSPDILVVLFANIVSIGVISTRLATILIYIKERKSPPKHIPVAVICKHGREEVWPGIFFSSEKS